MGLCSLCTPDMFYFSHHTQFWEGHFDSRWFVCKMVQGEVKVNDAISCLICLKNKKNFTLLNMETKFSCTCTRRNWVNGLKSLQDLQLTGEFGSAGNRSRSDLLYVAQAALGWLVVVIPWAYFHRWPRYDRQIALMLIQMKSKWTSACTGEGGLVFLSTCTSQGT